MAIDGNYDGIITIKKGQGLSQAISKELGLTQEECNKLGLSVWTQIFEQVEAQNNEGQIYRGGNDLKGPTNKNFIVDPDQVIKFSKDIWNKIVDIVNDNLQGKNIAKLGTDPNPPVENPPVNNPPNADPNPPVENTNPPANEPPKVDPNPPVKENPPEADANPPTNEKKPELAGQKVQVGENFVEYDENGYEVEIYDSKGNMTRAIRRNADGSIKFYDDYEKDDKGNTTRHIGRNADGSIKFYYDIEYDDEGNETKRTKRDADGNEIQE